MPAKPSVTILGGGFGGLETAFLARKLLGDRIDLTIVSDRDHFLFKPNTIYIPYGLDPEKLTVGLAKPARKKGIKLVLAKAHEINADNKTVKADGQELRYDYLVVATGATMRPDEIPGLAEHAQTIWTPVEMLKLRVAYYTLLEDLKAGKERRVLFLVPPNNKCSGPLYEMVLMLDTWLREHRVRQKATITFTTYERNFIQAFGPRLHQVMTWEFGHRGITGYNQYVAERVEADHVAYANGETLPYDLLISFPPHAAAQAFPGLPADGRGFIQTELQTRQVLGCPEIYAVGDTADFPVKQAFLAFEQGDAAAYHLAARVLGTEPEHLFDPISMCVMEQFDRATFAQVPLRLTGRPELPVEVRPEADGLYRVGSGKIWRLGKKAIGFSVPWRFSTGEPFHAGLPWKAMELSLKAMSAVLAK